MDTKELSNGSKRHVPPLKNSDKRLHRCTGRTSGGEQNFKLRRSMIYSSIDYSTAVETMQHVVLLYESTALKGGKKTNERSLSLIGYPSSRFRGMAEARRVVQPVSL